MSRLAWAAVIAAIIFPSLALVIVLLARPLAGGLEPPRLRPPPRHAPGPPDPGQMLERLRGELGLSDAQVEQIRALQEPLRVRAAAGDQTLRAAHDELRRLLDQPEASEAEVLAALRAESEARFEVASTTVLGLLRLRAALEPAQRARLKEVWRDRGGPGGLGGFGPPGRHGGPPGRHRGPPGLPGLGGPGDFGGPHPQDPPPQDLPPQDPPPPAL